MRLAPVILLLALVALSPLAQAHPKAVLTSPPSGGRLAESPAEAWVDFSQAPDPATLTLEVFDKAMQAVHAGAPRVEGQRATVALLPGLPEGGYLVKWSLVSPVDGHLIKGEWSFAVGEGALLATGEASSGVSWSVAAGKGLAFVGLAMVAGGVVTRLHVLRGPAGRLGARLVGFERAGALLQVGGLLIYLVGQASLAGQGIAAYALGSTFGKGLLARLVLALALAGWLFAPLRVGAQGRALDVTLLAGALLGYGASSHVAGMLGPWPLGVVVDAVHMGAVLAWTGGLAALVLLLRADDAEPKLLAEAGKRFSRLAALCVALMAATGALMLPAVLGLDLRAWPAHLSTGYGRLLAAMVVLGLLMMLVGASNHLRFLARFVGSPGREQRRALRGNVTREGAVGLVVLVVAAGLTNLAPGAALAPSLRAADVFAPCVGAEDAVRCQLDVLKVVQAERGSVVAFDLLVEGADADPDLAFASHAISHDLGRAAYAASGDIQRTLAQCSMKILGGCFHGALQAYFDSVETLDQPTVAAACPPGTAFERYTCLHGVGHGVLMATDYDLEVSLDLCGGIPTAADRHSCRHGVFMENIDSYVVNLTGVSGETIDRAHTHGDVDAERPHGRADPSDYAFPCNALDPMYSSPCWVFQSQLILFHNGNNFTDGANGCATLPGNASDVGYCFNGLGGALAGQTHADPRLVAGVCGLAPDPAIRVRCVEGWAETVMIYFTDPVVGLSRCAALSATDRGTCVHRVAYDGAGMVGVAPMEKLCARTGPYQERCLGGARSRTS